MFINVYKCLSVISRCCVCSTFQLCVTINNIEQVRRALKPLPETLGYSEIQKNMEKSHGEKGLRQVKTALHNMLRKADEEMTRRIKNVVDRVADKVG